MPLRQIEICVLTLGGVRFKCDPKSYDPFDWKKRGVVQDGPNGSVTIQEEGGLFAADNRLHLASPMDQHQWLDTETLRLLWALYIQEGAVHTLTDRFDNQMRVWMENFHPIPDIVDFWAYTMDLVVVDVQKFLGVAYSGG